MNLIYLILVLAIIGVIVWAITTYLPMAPMIKNIIYLIVIIAACLWLLRAFSGGGSSFSIG